MSAPTHSAVLLVHRHAPEPVILTDLGTQLHEFHNACGPLSVTYAYNRAMGHPVPLDAWSLQQMLVLARIVMPDDGTVYSYGTRADDTVLQRCADLLYVDISLYCMNLTSMDQVFELTGVRQFSSAQGVARTRLVLGHYLEHYVALRDADGASFLSRPPRQISYRPDLSVGSPVWTRVMEYIRALPRSAPIPHVPRSASVKWNQMNEAARRELLDTETMIHYEALITDPRHADCTDSQHETLLAAARRIAERVIRARYAEAVPY